ncbi:Six-hairpin glycosidase [Amylostereum chailletii]|nr:Six-hairpin glycosidase [Amylostereum chailletii]
MRAPTSAAVAAAFLLSTSIVQLAAAIPYSSPSLTREDNNVDIDLVRDNAKLISVHSWELGTLAEALTELEYPQYSVFNEKSAFPVHARRELPQDVLNISETIIAARLPNMTTLIDGDGAAGDPASLGVAVILANWTLTDDAAKYGEAAKEQLDHLLYTVPRTPSGAISQRESEVQLWADFIYMVPPFLAYYGAVQGGKNGSDLLQEAYDQCRLYRDELFDADVHLWRHIDLGSWSDAHHWGTGNAWAAAGMMRVLATLRASEEGQSMIFQQANLIDWIDQTLIGVWKYQQKNGTLLNYLDLPVNQTFADTSSTALLAATSYRLASVTGHDKHIKAADSAYDLIMREVDEVGWLHNTVDPLSFSTPSVPGSYSPEGQSFTLLLHVAHDAYYQGKWVDTR